MSTASKARFTLHRYIPAYLPEMTDLWVESWSDTLPEIDFEARRGWFVERISAACESGAAVICAFDPANGAMAGFVTIEPQSGYLDQIAVSLRQRGQGAARVLLGAAQQVSPQGIHLNVNEANGRARAFYAREGFIEVGRGVSAASGLPIIALSWRPKAYRE